jgi:hypothetical protein
MALWERLAMEQAFVDTGAWYAYINAKDPDYSKIKKFLESFSGRLVTSNYVFDEIITLVLARLGYQRAVKVGEVLLNPGVVELVRVRAGDERAAWQLFKERPDKTYSFTDCTSFVLMRRLDLATAITLDGHFGQENFEVVP